MFNRNSNKVNSRKSLSKNRELTETRLMETKGGFGSVIIPGTYSTSSSGNQKPEENVKFNF